MTLEIQNFYDLLSARAKREYLLKNKILSAILWLNKSRGIGRYQNKDILNVVNKYLEIDSLKTISEKTLRNYINSLLSTKINNHILLTKEVYTISKRHGGGGVVKYYPSPLAKDLLKNFFRSKVTILKAKKLPSLHSRKVTAPIYNSYSYSVSVFPEINQEERKERKELPKESRAETFSKKKEKSFIPYEQQYQQAKEELKEKGIKDSEQEEIQKGIIQKPIKENILIYLNSFLNEIAKMDKSFIQKAIRVFTKEIKKDFSTMSSFKPKGLEFTRLLNYFLKEKQLKERELKERQEKALLAKEKKNVKEVEEKEFANFLEEKELSLTQEEKEYQDFLFEQALSFRKQQFPKYPLAFLEKGLKEACLIKVLEESQNLKAPYQNIFFIEDSLLKESVFSHFNFFFFKEETQAI